MRSDLPDAYEALPGFRGLVVLVRPGEQDHVIALTLWADAESVTGSERNADTVVGRIAMATGATATREIYEVLGTLGVVDDTAREGSEPVPARRRRFSRRSTNASSEDAG